MTSPPSDLDVHCYVRAPVVGATERIVDALSTHARAGRINSLTVQQWPATVALESTAMADLVETVEQFRDWASERGATLAPAFSVDERVSELTAERTTLLRLPVVCLAVYEDDALYCVIPNRTDERTCTVPKALGILETADPTRQRSVAPSTPMDRSSSELPRPTRSPRSLREGGDSTSTHAERPSLTDHGRSPTEEESRSRAVEENAPGRDPEA